MQIELGAPIEFASAWPLGVLPLTGRVAGGGGTSIVNIRRNFPSVSKTWILRFDRSPTYTLLLRSIAIACGRRN